MCDVVNNSDYVFRALADRPEIGILSDEPGNEWMKTAVEIGQVYEIHNPLTNIANQSKGKFCYKVEPANFAKIVQVSDPINFPKGKFTFEPLLEGTCTIITQQTPELKRGDYSSPKAFTWSSEQKTQVNIVAATTVIPTPVIPTPGNPTPPPPPSEFEQNKKNHVTIDIYGKNDPAYGGDVLFIDVSDPKDYDASAIPGTSAPLNKSNYKMLTEFINAKLDGNFKNAFNKDINSGTKGIFDRQTNFRMAKSEIQKKLFTLNTKDAYFIPIEQFSAQLAKLKDLNGNDIDEEEIKSWRLPDCTVDYTDVNNNNENWNTMSVGVVYHIIVGKTNPAVTNNLKDMADIRIRVKANLNRLRGLIGTSSNTQKGQTSSIDTLVTKVDTIDDKQLNTIDKNLTGMFEPDPKTPLISKIENNTYRNLWYAVKEKLFFKKETKYFKSVAATNPLTGDGLVNILTTGFMMQGGKTKKHKKLHKRRIRKTYKR